MAESTQALNFTQVTSPSWLYYCTAPSPSTVGGIRLDGELAGAFGSIFANFSGGQARDGRMGLAHGRGTIASPSALLSGDRLGTVEFYGHDGSALPIGADMSAIAAENFGASAHGTDLRFRTTPQGSTTIAEVARLTSEGLFGVACTDPQSELEVASTKATFPRGIISSQFSSDTHGAEITGRKARGTRASPSAVLSGDALQDNGSQGYDGTGFFDGAFLRYFAEQNWSSTAHGSGALLLAVKKGTTSLYEVVRFDSEGNIVPGPAGLATTVTDGFWYLESCAGAPTGTPTSYTNRVPVIYDRTNNKIYAYNGGWKSVQLA